MKRCHPGLAQGLIRGVTVGLLAGACLQAWADAKKNPYESIVDRNPFGLKPPPPPPDPSANTPAPPPAPPATVKVTGITSILSSKRALLEIVPAPGKPMIKPILSEGERIESIEVLAINVDKNEVTIKNGLLVTNMTFEVVKNTAPPPPGTPGAPGTPGVLPSAAGQPQQTTMNQSMGTGRNNVMVAGGAPPVTPAGAAGAANADGSFRSIPQRNIRTTAPQGQPSLEEHYIMTELNRNSHGIPLPPTPLNPNPQYNNGQPVVNQPQTQPYQNQNYPATPGPHRSIGGTPNLPGNYPSLPGGVPQ